MSCIHFSFVIASRKIRKSLSRGRSDIPARFEVRSRREKVETTDDDEV